MGKANSIGLIEQDILLYTFIIPNKNVYKTSQNKYYKKKGCLGSYCRINPL